MTFNDIVMWGLLLFGLGLLLYDVKSWLMPDRKGRVVAIEDQLKRAEEACECGKASAGRSHLTATVRLEDGSLVPVDMSPCLICMDKVRLGSQMGLNRIGDRWIARRYIDLLGRGLPNDSVPLPCPSEAEECMKRGVVE
jgi:hypothetical protein